MILTALIGLENHPTRFNGWPRSIGNLPDNARYNCRQIFLGRGDILIFRSDLVHAGAGFDEENVRLHCFIEVPGVVDRKTGAETHFQPEDQNDVIVK